MGKAASYFHNTNTSEKKTLHNRITPNEAQFDDQQARWNDLAEFLIADLKERSDYPIRTWLQGSYKFATQVRPVHITEEFDIDLGIYYCWAGDRDEGNFTPKQLKQFVQSGLEQFASLNDDVIELVMPPKPRCCRLRFKGNFHIDVPCYHLNDALDVRSLATEKNSWEDSDPKAIYIWFKDQFADHQRVRVRRFVRYVKAWAALKFRDAEFRPSSLLLTVLIAEETKQVLDVLPAEDDDALSVVLRRVSDRLNNQMNVRNPVDNAENLAGRLSETNHAVFVDKIKAFADTAFAASKDENTVSACTQWAQEFEHLFPLPELEQLDELVQNVPAVRTIPEVQVSAISRENASWRYTGVNGIGPIPKKCDITFQVTNSLSMPVGTQYFWTVRNEGDEAEDTNDLGHIGGSGLKAHESSAYKGSHFMDCTAMLNGQTIGLRRVLVKINGVSPIRKKAQRSGLIKLLGKR